MEKLKKYAWAIVLGIVVLWGFSWYNGTVSAQEDVKGQWAKVESSYQRRNDLIPGLVKTVMQYASHEKEVLTQVTESRAKVGQVNINSSSLNSESIQKFQQAQDGLSSALSRLMVVMERYPDLKANQNFIQLQAQIEGTENRINVERNRFSDDAEKFNKRIKKIPGKLFNLIAGFEEKGYFEAQKGAENAPDYEELYKD